MANDLGISVRNALIDLLSPLQEAARDPKALIEWLATLGQTETIAADPALLEIARHAQVLTEKLAAFDAQTLKSWTGLTSILESGREVSDIQRELRRFAEDPGRIQIAEGLAEEVMALLLASYLRRRHPTAFRVAALLTLIEAREHASLEPPLIENGSTLRYPRVLDHFKLALVSGLISRPGETLKAAYFPNSMSVGADAWSAAALLFSNVSFLADQLDLPWRTEYRSTADSTPSTDADPEEALLGHVRFNEDAALLAPPPPVPDTYFAAHFPTVRLTIVRSDSGPDNEAAIEIQSSSAQHPGAIPGYIVTPAGNFNTTLSSGLWRLALSATGQIPAFVLKATGFELAPGGLPVSGGAAKMLLERLPPEGSSGPVFVFGSAEGSRLELSSVSVAANLIYDPTREAVIVSADAAQCSFVIAPDDGDNFLRGVLPSEGVKADFSLGLVWSSDQGLALRGAGGLDATLSIGVSIGGVVTVPAVHLRLQASDAGLLADASASIGVSIGPVSAMIDRVGLSGALAFPEDGGNFGVADLDLGFKAPDGVGLEIDATAVTGSGFLYFDPQRGQYAGVLALSLQGGLSLTAVGLIATRLPDASPGFSLLVLITAADFTPIALGMGFSLTGIGGLLALNRTFDDAALRTGLKAHTLDSILFPADPLRNAPQILSNLNRVFPGAMGHYLFGPMLRLAWGTPALITADLAVVLEFGARLRLLILGQLVAILPRPEHELLRLQLDAIGVVDFDQGSVALDAALYDSRLLKKFVLTGDMALRLNWAGSPTFALAVGGLHPAFTPPANFPKLERIALNLAAGDNPRLRCEAYFAITANTLQFGARAELYAAAAGFSLQGELGFDVLIQRDPFVFLAAFVAQVQLKRGKTNLFKVRVEGSLAGPRPLHITGKATFEILWWDVTVRVDTTLVAGQAPPRPAPIDVLPRLRAALADGGNWRARLPEGQRALVVLRERAGGAEVLLHPLGTLTVTQGVVPLDVEIARFGSSTPAGARRFVITQVSVGGAGQTRQAVKELFAPGQYLELSEDEQLTRPSFESLAAGVRIGTEGLAIGEAEAAWLEVDAIGYETITLDSETDEAHAGDAGTRYTVSAELLGKQVGYGAAGSSGLRRSGSARYQTGREGHRVVKEGWSVVATEDLTVQALAGSEADRPSSYAQAVQALEHLRQQRPAQAAGLQILRLSELGVRG